jgi:hypothetical protein
MHWENKEKKDLEDRASVSSYANNEELHRMMKKRKERNERK